MPRSVTGFTLALVFLAAPLAAQDTTATDSLYQWKRSLIVDFTTTQTAYSNSWTGGENGSLNWVSNLVGQARKQMSQLVNYSTNLKLSFGQTITQEVDSTGDRTWSRPEKSTDLIDWEHVARFTLHRFADPYAALRLETQFFDGSNAAKRLYFSPLKLTESVGGARKLYERGDDIVITRLGVAVRQLFTKVVVDNTTLETETIDAHDVGMESVTDATLSLHKRITYVGKLGLFRALSSSNEDDEAGTGLEGAWKAIDVNFENIIKAEITKVITVSLYMQLLYDKEIVDKGRIKETLALGLAYKIL